MRFAEEFDAVQRLAGAGMNERAIAQETGIPRRTRLDEFVGPKG
jgi:hypothetical protein